MKHKSLLFLSLIFLIILSIPQSTYASENYCTSTKYSISPCSDTIIKQYRKHNNKLQYRRWNTTKECWVDPDWIDM